MILYLQFSQLCIKLLTGIKHIFSGSIWTDRCVVLYGMYHKLYGNRPKVFPPDHLVKMMDLGLS
jgi:hypothetical protein